MNFLSSLSNAVINASAAALSASTGSIPNVPGYSLGERVVEYDRMSIWTLYEGVKRVRLG